jgi:hypothetical protein
MTPRQNLLGLYRRSGSQWAPVCSNLCPDLERQFHERYPQAADYAEQFQFPMRLIMAPGFPWIAEIPGFAPARQWDYGLYYDPPIAPGARARMYRDWLKPRLKRVIDAAKAVKPDILIQYHSCGYVTPLVGDLVEAGIDILNPVQPECMDVEQVLSDFRGVLSFNGTIGTQTTMPFGTPEEVKATVRRNLERAGPRGGLFCCPTHMLEPEVPWENVEAYVEACREWSP